MKKLGLILGCLVVISLLVSGVGALENELYPGESALWEEAKKEGIVVSYDTGPTWANWAGVFKKFTQRYDIEIVYNDLGSGATVVRLEKEKNRPNADTAYYFMPFGASAKDKGVTEAFQPVNFDQIPDILKDPEGHWFSIHKGTVVFVINKKLAKRIPRGWKDLLEPDFKKSIVYLDPRTTGIGYAIVLATAHALGGSVDNLMPGIEYLAELQKRGNIRLIEKTTEYDKFVKGEIPVWITYDFNGYRAKYIGGLGDEVEMVIPQEGTITAPYAISLVKGAPHPQAARLWLNFILSEEGQKTFAEGFVRPILDVPMPEEIIQKFLPQEEYARAMDIDWVKAQAVQPEAAKLWGRYVLGEE
ncbi:MAG: extracellular solute-binding protein [Candidatus Caldatribacteriaceae bacterium]